MAQSAGKSRPKPTGNSDSVLGEGELSAQHAYSLLKHFDCYYFFFLLK